jgi:hypothetical protein
LYSLRSKGFNRLLHKGSNKPGFGINYFPGDCANRFDISE